MNFRFYLEKLHSSDVFKQFMKENPKAYMCSGFFTIDTEGNDNQRHIDFYIPDKKEMFSFKLDKEVEKVPIEMAIERVPDEFPMTENLDFELEDVEKMISAEMAKQDIRNKLQKIIISLQNVDGKNLLVCTVFISMLGLLKVHIDIKDMKIVLFEKKSFLDMMRKVK